MDIFKQSQKILGLGLVNVAMGSYILYRAVRKIRNMQMKAKSRQQQRQEEKKGKEQQLIYRICVTGGPQGGKTTSMSILNEKLTDKGFKVFMVPHVAALSSDCGAAQDLPRLSETDRIKLVIERVKYQMALEDYFTDLAMLAGQPSVVLCDGGVMDNHALVSNEVWQMVLDEQGWNNIYLRDQRYDHIIHLKTPSQQQDDLQKDHHIQVSWSGHPHLMILESEQGFDTKMLNAIDVLYKVIGLPTANKVFKKLLLESFEMPEEVAYQTFLVEEVFLTSKSGEERKVRKRGQNGAFSYVYSRRSTDPLSDMRNELRKPISAQEYLSIIEANAHPGKAPVKKQRITFVYQNKAFKIDVVLNSPHKIQLLRYQEADNEKQVDLPFVKILKDVTHDKEYSTSHIALIK